MFINCLCINDIINLIANSCEIFALVVFTFGWSIIKYHRSHRVKFTVSSVQYNEKYVTFKLVNKSGYRSKHVKDIGYRLFFTDKNNHRTRYYILPNVFSAFKNIKKIELNGDNFVKTISLNNFTHQGDSKALKKISNTIYFKIPLTELEHEFEALMNLLKIGDNEGLCINIEFICKGHKKYVSIFYDVLMSYMFKHVIRTIVNGKGICLSDMWLKVNNIYRRVRGLKNSNYKRINYFMSTIYKLVHELDIYNNSQKHVYIHFHNYLSNLGIVSKSSAINDLQNERNNIEKYNNLHGINIALFPLIDSKENRIKHLNSSWIKSEFSIPRSINIIDVCKISRTLLEIINNA